MSDWINYVKSESCPYRKRSGTCWHNYFGYIRQDKLNWPKARLTKIYYLKIEEVCNLNSKIAGVAIHRCHVVQTLVGVHSEYRKLNKHDWIKW